jgi:hypothetical protein
MPVGLNANLTKATVDATIGDAAQALNRAFLDVEAAQVFLAGYTVADLEALGYTADEANTLKSAMADLDRLRLVYQGIEAVPEPYDFTTFARRVFGTGYVPGR